MKIEELKTEPNTPRKWMLSKVEDNTMSMLVHSCQNNIPMIISGIEQEVIVEFFETGTHGNIAKVIEITKLHQHLNDLPTAEQSLNSNVSHIAIKKNDNRLWSPEQMCAQALAENPNCKSALLIMIDKDDSSFFVHYAANLSKEEKIAFMEYQKAMFMRDIV